MSEPRQSARYLHAVRLRQAYPYPGHSQQPQRHLGAAFAMDNTQEKTYLAKNGKRYETRLSVTVLSQRTQTD